MTKNQVDALKNLETERHNREQEKIDKILIPAQYLSSIGSLARGVSGFFNIKGKSKGKDFSADRNSSRSQRRGSGYSAPHLTPTTWTIQ